MSFKANAQQKQAIEALSGPMLILAGAGTGKTFVITERVKYLIEKNVSPEKIVCVTFSNKAAAEMKHRLMMPDLKIGTFHSLCLNFLIDNELISDKISLIDEADQRKVCDKLNILQHMTAIQKYKEQIFFKEMAGFHLAYRNYQNFLEENHLIDFTDIVLITLDKIMNSDKIREAFSVEHLIVDEFQDTNSLQYELIKHWTKTDNLFLVGDPDQLIYSWRGADTRNISRFRLDYSDHQLVKLEENYRSTKHILDVANAVINEAPNRIPKALWCRKEGEKVSMVYAEDEAKFIADKIKTLKGTIAILVRASSQIKSIEQELIAEQIQYRISGGIRFFDRLELKVVIAYLRVILNDDLLSLERVVAYPKCGIGDKKLEKIQQLVAEGLSLFDSIREVGASELASKLTEWRKIINAMTPELFISHFISESGLDILFPQNEHLRTLKQKIGKFNSVSEFLLSFFTMEEFDQQDVPVIISTIHGAKGCEFDNVFVSGLLEGMLPISQALHGPQLEEERRLLYVAITRAKEQLFLTYSIRGSFSNVCRFLFKLPSSAIARSFR